ncbi:MAG: orotidine-5'-phosphate decarboxylase [Firmicutes bacterium]|nr:orotidine-5'-phosphate decarboxylase [Bacillota bacterium]
MKPNEHLIVALDVDSKERALELARVLTPQVDMFKVGMELFYSCGPDLIHTIRELGAKIFIDLKLHDIPNTVSRAVKVLTRYGAEIINVHAAGGTEMMQAAARAAGEEAVRLGIRRPRVIAVTVLTSLGQEEFNNQIGITGSIEERVKLWAKMAQDSGLDGVVASAREAAAIRQMCGKQFIIVTPGIRPAGSAAGDQKRIVTPADALKAGSTYLVVGRPVTAAEDPAAAARQIIDEMSLK